MFSGETTEPSQQENNEILLEKETNELGSRRRKVSRLHLPPWKILSKSEFIEEAEKKRKGD